MCGPSSAILRRWTCGTSASPGWAWWARSWSNIITDGNNHLVELLESLGAEAIVPDLYDFILYGVYNAVYRYRRMFPSQWAPRSTDHSGAAGAVPSSHPPTTPKKPAFRPHHAHRANRPQRQAVPVHRQPVGRGLVPHGGDGVPHQGRRAQHRVHAALRVSAQPRGGQGRHPLPTGRLSPRQHRAHRLRSGATPASTRSTASSSCCPSPGTGPDDPKAIAGSPWISPAWRLPEDGCPAFITPLRAAYVQRIRTGGSAEPLRRLNSGGRFVRIAQTQALNDPVDMAFAAASAVFSWSSGGSGSPIRARNWLTLSPSASCMS